MASVVRRILVTGATGFVGGHVVPMLATAGNVVLGIGREAPGRIATGAAYERVDLLDADAIADCVARFRPTVILHLAGLASVADAVSGPTRTWQVNVGGLMNLVEAARALEPGGTFFFVSSGEVYGGAFLSGKPVAEDAAPEPRNTYARTKWVGEQLLHDLLPRIGMKLVVLRPFNHIGPGQDERFVVASFAGQLARIEAGLAPPEICVGNLSSHRDFLDVSDVTRAYADLIDRSDDLPTGSVFNIASGEPRTIESVLDGLRGLARVPCGIRIDPDRVRPAEIPLAAGDATRLQSATGWTPNIPWQTALARVMDDARARLSAGGEGTP